MPRLMDQFTRLVEVNVEGVGSSNFDKDVTLSGPNTSFHATPARNSLATSKERQETDDKPRPNCKTTNWNGVKNTEVYSGFVDESGA